MPVGLPLLVLDNVISSAVGVSVTGSLGPLPIPAENSMLSGKRLVAYSWAFVEKGGTHIAELAPCGSSSAPAITGRRVCVCVCVFILEDQTWEG